MPLKILAILFVGILLWVGYMVGYQLQQARLQPMYDWKVQHTAKRLETAYRQNMAQGKQAEWFNLYAYLLYRVSHKRISPYAVDREVGYPPGHPCACERLNLGWVEFEDGVVVSGLTIFWDRPQPDLMVPFCMDVNGKAGPNQSGRDIFIGRLYNRQPNTQAYFDWHSTAYACPGQTYVPVDVALKRLKADDYPD